MDDRARPIGNGRAGGSFGMELGEGRLGADAVEGRSGGGLGRVIRWKKSCAREGVNKENRRGGVSKRKYSPM
jgi:hypothetical protein